MHFKTFLSLHSFEDYSFIHLINIGKENDPTATGQPAKRSKLNVRKEFVSVTDAPDLHVYNPCCEHIPGKQLECNNFLIENNTILVT
jgi:hypothetical protein